MLFAVSELDDVMFLAAKRWAREKYGADFTRGFSAGFGDWADDIVDTTVGYAEGLANGRLVAAVIFGDTE